MALTSTNQLFSRDLKHLVDSKYSVSPARKFPPFVTIVTGMGIVAALIIMGSFVLHLIGPDDGASDVADKSAVTSNQISDETNSGASAQVEHSQTGNDPEAGQKADTSVASQNTKADATGKTGKTQLHEVSGKQIAINWREYEIKSGDSLGRIFVKHGLSTADAIRVAEHSSADKIQNLIPGRKLRIGIDENNELRALVFELRSRATVEVVFELDGSLSFREHAAPPDDTPKTVTAVIEDSFFKAGAQAGLDNRMLQKLVTIFSWEIDFARDLNQGDRFTVVYSEVQSGKEVPIAARVDLEDRELFAFRQVSKDGQSTYYDVNGKSLKSDFLRTPMKISRITSGVSKSRTQPTLEEWQDHQGLDYPAARGTPVLATADGEVDFLGDKVDYGKTIVLNHGSSITTVYAHLSSFKNKIGPGTRVKQGQIIGFVGKSGMATAPHLHYEFRVDGNHVDPLTYDMPKGESIAQSELSAFTARSAKLRQLMTQHDTVQLAQN